MILIFKFYFFHKDRNYLYPSNQKIECLLQIFHFLIALYTYNLSVIT